MDVRRLGRSGVLVSELALGTMTFGQEADEAAAAEILDRYLDAGGNFVDTADVYGAGASEEVLGKLLGRRRPDVVLATKGRFATGPGVNDVGASRRHLLDTFHASLRRLGTDWVDLYQVHCWDPNTPLEETLSTLDGLVRSGAVRYIGASNYAGWQLAKALGVSALHGWEPFVSLQPEYSLVSRDVELDLLPLCLDDGLAVIPWAPLGSGVLTGKYQPGADPPPNTRAGDGRRAGIHDRMGERNLTIADEVGRVAADLGRTAAQVALNWVMHRPGVTAPIVGARSAAQLTDTLGAVGWRLDDDARERLDALSRPTLGYPHNVHDRNGLRPAGL
jgi:aryl-alcohol dehydrogenase-like predicted oxidoreductase